MAGPDYVKAAEERLHVHGYYPISHRVDFPSDVLMRVAVLWVCRCGDFYESEKTRKKLDAKWVVD